MGLKYCDKFHICLFLLPSVTQSYIANLSKLYIVDAISLVLTNFNT